MRSLIVSLLTALLVVLGSTGCGSKNKSNHYPVPAGMDMTGSRQGHSVAFVDVDGDGKNDKLVGAPYFKAESGRFGAVLIYRGTDSGFDSEPSSMLEDGDNSGYAIVNTGDVDQDGMNDFAVGAIHGDGDDVSLAGTVTVYKGGGNGKIIRKLSGEWPMDKFGFSLAAGDLNGDGYADVVVGAPFNTNDPALYQSGAVYVFFGPDLTAFKALYADANNKGLGWAVATGDINGDGHTDLLIVSNKTVSNITTYSVLGFYGAANGEVFSPSITAPDVVISSTAAGFGKALAVIGNLDAAPGDEIAIGAPNAVLSLAGVSSRDVGSVYFVSTGSGTSINVDTPAPAGSLLARLDGETLFSRFGSSISAAGDVDSMGKPDIAIGAPMIDVEWNILSGKVYLFKGESIAALTPWSNSSVFEGMVKNQSYGTSLAFANSALLIGAPRSNADTGGSGMVNPATGLAVSGGSSGGSSGGGGECH